MQYWRSRQSPRRHTHARVCSGLAQRYYCYSSSPSITPGMPSSIMCFSASVGQAMTKADCRQSRRAPGAALAQTPQRLAFVQGDMGGLFAFDLILRLIFVCVMDVAFVIQIFGVDAHDFAADSTSFRIPTRSPILNLGAIASLLGLKTTLDPGSR